MTHADRSSALDEVAARFASGRGFALATINLDHLVKLRADAAFRAAYRAQDIVVADGNPIVWLAGLAGEKVDLVPGSDLVVPLVAAATAAGLPVALVGGTAPMLKAAWAEIARAVPGARLALAVAPAMGFDPEGSEAQAILADVAAAGPCLVLLALGAPRQERLAALGRGLAPQAGFASIGAGLDFLAGTRARAPDWMRAMALEWLWRAMTEPGRLVPRYLACAAILPRQALAAWRQRAH